MKKFLLLVTFLSVYHITLAQDLKTEKDSLSYALGITIGTQLESDNLDINSDVFASAIEAVKNTDAKMTIQEAQAVISKFFTERANKLSKENKERGEKFLAQNKEKPGVVALPSGIQYQVLKEGEGEKPGINDRVKVHYVGTTIDGKQFDSSIDRGEPATFGLGQVIQGWTQTLPLMPVGSKWRIFIPDELAYGQQAPPTIGPNQTLIFEIELLEIVK